MYVSTLIAWCNMQYEPNATTFLTPDERWIALFNEALVDLKPNLKLHELATTDLVSGLANYGMPVDFVKMHLLQVADKNGEYYDYPQLQVNDQLSIGYKLWEDIELQPVPDYDYTAGLKIYFYKSHPVLASTNSLIEISDPYLLGLFALARLESGDRALDVSSYYYREYRARMVNLTINQIKLIDDYLIRDVYG